MCDSHIFMWCMWFFSLLVIEPLFFKISIHDLCQYITVKCTCQFRVTFVLTRLWKRHFFACEKETENNELFPLHLAKVDGIKKCHAQKKRSGRKRESIHWCCDDYTRKLLRARRNLLNKSVVPCTFFFPPLSPFHDPVFPAAPCSITFSNPSKEISTFVFGA